MDEAGLRGYLSTHLDPLRRTAYLMCGDWHTADDVVATVVLKVYRGWDRISRMENLDAYVRRALVNAWLDERRRPCGANVRCWTYRYASSRHPTVPSTTGSASPATSPRCRLGAVP